MKTNEKIERQKASLVARIEKNLGKKITGFELAELRGSSADVKALGISSKSGTGSAWGLILFCEKEIFFYYPATEGMFDFFFRQNSGEGPAEDQFVQLDNLEQLEFSVPKKTLFSFLNPEEKLSIIMKAIKDEYQLQLQFICMNNAAPVFEKLQGCLQK